MQGATVCEMIKADDKTSPTLRKLHRIRAAEERGKWARAAIPVERGGDV